ncbi:MAG: M6 family metalloprotease domain-containing protein [Prevotella sp.]|jgi:immune inhibitor A
MKRLFSMAALACAVSVVMALPVRRGQWQTVTLADGSTVRVEARGDENMHYWQSADGNCYVRVGDTHIYREVLQESLKQNVVSSVTRASGVKKLRARSLRENLTQNNRLTGKKHALVILVDFSGKTFSMANPVELYKGMFSATDYHENGFNGSLHDYFYAQSHGKFDLAFDVVGPVTMPYSFAHYGRNDDDKVGEMVHDACLAVNDEVDFSKYDWEGDGEADMVYILYAGYGEADHTGNESYIWPHMYRLSYYPYYENETLKLDGTVIDTYACSNEMGFDNRLVGIGTICHEFSHCLGLPDMYDTVSDTNFGMGSWDLMDYGCYNDNGYTPSGYTGYEKMMLGWSTPLELKTPVAVTAMQPASSMGRSYIVYNPNNRQEFYVLDNRQLRGFDAALPGHGMIITHVDYDAEIWDNNIINSTGYDSNSGLTNSHRRATICPADNDADNNTEGGDAYPYGDNDSLTVSSQPAIKWYNGNSEGETHPDFGLFNIREHGDGTMAFCFGKGTAGSSSCPILPENDERVLLYETFDGCMGSGGNDGKFKGNIAQAAFYADLPGWEYDNAYGADRCARFGKSYAGTGMVTSPPFRLSGDTVTLVFRAAGWAATADGDKLLLSLSGGDATFVESENTDMSLTMIKGAWSTYTLRIVGEGDTRITFTPSNRFFLDDVKIASQVTSGIVAHESHVREASTGRIYNIDGKCVGTDFDALPRGVYIVDGRKVVK